MVKRFPVKQEQRKTRPRPHHVCSVYTAGNYEDSKSSACMQYAPRRKIKHAHTEAYMG